MDNKERDSRREFLRYGATGTLLLLSGCASQSRVEEGVSANEDLMREHAVLDRLLLVYEASRLALLGDGVFPATEVWKSANLIREFIEDYHEKLEEQHLFPRFEQAARHVELVNTLRQQHQAGRRVTDFVLEQTAALGGPSDGEGLARALEAFGRMYRPHAAREATVLFPALRELVSSAELAELGEQFEEIEEQRFGHAGFETVVAEVADIEGSLGIYELSQFTAEP